jgi:glutathione synthase
VTGVRHLFIIDAHDRLSLAGDTSFALMLECARRGDEVWTCQLEHLALEHDRAFADAVATQVVAETSPARAFTFGDRVYVALSTFDLVFMRKDPPLDVSYLHATWILEHVGGTTLVVNDPHGLRELNEHLAVLRFPELTPPTLVTRSSARLQQFLREQGGDMVLKPVDGYGGLGIFVVRQGDPNTSSLLETATGAGSRWALAQRYLPEAMAGDKRIVVVDGEIVGAVLRVPAESEARGNLHVGGRPERCDIDARDREIVARIAPVMATHGQVFVGLDVIGGMLTEINITSPTGVRHIEALEGRNVAGEVIDRLVVAARRLAADPGR